MAESLSPSLRKDQWEQPWHFIMVGRQYLWYRYFNVDSGTLTLICKLGLGKIYKLKCPEI